MYINKTLINKNSKTYFIAELSANHCQNKTIALNLIKAAKESGADAVKLQTYTPDTMTLNCDNEHFKINTGTIWDGKTLYELYKNAYTPWEWHKELKDYANELGMDFFSTPFDESAVDFLDDLGVPLYKIASFEVTDHILLKKIASKGKPVILSTGIVDLPQLSESVQILRNHGVKDIIIMKCTSAYPASIEDANLNTIPNIANTFNVIPGLSDHTLGIEVPIAAVCLGAKVIEKHFTLDRSSGSPDDKFSLLPSEFKQMVESIRKVEKSLGVIKYDKSNNELKSRIFTRSLFVSEDVKRGDIITKYNIRSVRPGTGMHTRNYDLVLGKRFNCDIKYGSPLCHEVIDYHEIRNILFLGYMNCPLVDYLVELGYNVTTTDKKVTNYEDYDFVVSYGYKLIIPQRVIDMFNNRIINLHISYLPWNKGISPNMWSFIDKTLKGVTIHYMDEGIDTGDIIVQKEVKFNDTDTLSTSYNKLRDEIEQLFMDQWEQIVSGKCNRIKQMEKGTYHSIKDRNAKLLELKDGYDTLITNL